MNQAFGNRHHHKGYLLKSNAEYSFALLLDRLMEAEGDGRVLSWSYEPRPPFWFDKIKQGTLSYLPDFKVEWHGGEVVFYEIKRGYFEQKDITKYRRMASRHPNVKLVLVFQEISQTNSRSAIRLRCLIDTAKKYVDHIWQVGEDYKRLGIPTKF